MKKLMFATALVASAVAFADPPTALNANGFEGYTADSNVTVGDASDPAGLMYFLYQGDTDGSTVKAFGVGDNLAAPSITRPYFFQGTTPNANYLELSTEGGTLWRSINILGTDGPEGGATTNILGTAQAVTTDGIYLDTLVQFTPTEDGGAPELDPTADKLALWLNVDSNGVTNLMVRAAVVDDNGRPTPTNFTITNKTVNAGAWYRLTVKAFADIANGEKIPGFQIRIDGKVLMSDTLTMTPELLEYMQGEDNEADLLNGALFASLLGSANSFSLQGVGFKGSGALDDLVWTTEDPFQGGAGGDNYEVTIGNTPVPITPTAADLAAIAAAAQEAGQTIDVTDTAAVNALLATEIGNTGIQAWEAAFLGVEPSADGLEQVAIKSISFDEDGKVVVEMADAIELKTGRGVTINLILKGSDDLTTWTTLQTATDTTEFTAITPAANETKKFYKVVVEFAATPAQN